MNLEELDYEEFASALIDAYRDRNADPEEYEKFTSTEEMLERSIEGFSFSIDSVDEQLASYADDPNGRSPEWAHAARRARVHYRAERMRLTRIHSAIRRKAREEQAQRNIEANRAGGKLHKNLLNLIEELAIRLENAGGEISDLEITSGGASDSSITLDTWLDKREEKRAA